MELRTPYLEICRLGFKYRTGQDTVIHRSAHRAVFHDE